jgi:hypothetical protein
VAPSCAALRRRLVRLFLSALEIAAGKEKVPFPDAKVIDAEVDLYPAGTGFEFAARLNVSLPASRATSGKD